MALVFAVLIEGVTLLCAGGVMFAGMMRTTGSSGDDVRTARWIFICGSILAGLVAVSHLVGW
jgi:hypothetical protein